MELNENAVIKIIKMFRPYGDGNFLNFNGKETICSPSDRAMIGYDNNFPKQWLIEDWDFTDDEADWFIGKVNELSKT